MSNATITFPILGDGFAINASNCFTLFGITIHWYGVLIALGFVLGGIYAYCRCKDFGLDNGELINMLLFAMPISIICARLYYVVFNFSLYEDNLSSVFKIWEGGLAIYGGIIGAVLTVIVYCRVRKLSVGAMLDVGAFGLLIGQSIGRWGNFINREAFGVSENVNEFFLRMGLTPPGGETIYVHPTFLYESLWNITGFVILHFLSKKLKNRYDGQIFAMYIAWYGLGRFLIEGLRADSLYLFNTGLRVSQMLALCSCFAAVAFLVYKAMKNKKERQTV